MVSRLFTSISGIFKKASEVDVDGNAPAKPEDANDPKTKSDAKQAQAQQLSKPKSGENLVDPESLDRSLVNQFHSKLTAAGLDALLDIDTAAEGVRSRCELVPTEEKKEITSALNGSRSKHSLLPDEIGDSGDGDEGKNDQTDALRHETESQDSDDHEDQEKQQENSVDKRSVVFKNSQFDLSNSNDTMNSFCKLVLSKAGDLEEDKGLTPTSSMESLSSLLKVARKISKQHRRPHRVTPSPHRSFKIPSMPSTSVNDGVLDSAIEDIIKKGGDDFRKKYSTWIWDAFRSQMNRLKALMVSEFHEQLKEALDEKEKEYRDMRKRYRDKIQEFEVTTQGFQALMDTTFKETQKLSQSKDATIDKLKKEFIEVKRRFEQDLHRKLKNFRNEAELERQELQKRNDELMKIMMAAEVPERGAQDAYKNEVSSLHKMIKTLTYQNEMLHRKLEARPMTLLDSGDSSKENVENLELKLEASKSEVDDLKKKLKEIETEKQDRIVAHHSDVATLNKRIQETNTKYDRKLKDALGEVKAVRTKYTKEIKELKDSLAAQEAHHASVLNTVRQQYGSKVEELSNAVSQLKSKISTSKPSGHTKHHHSSHHHHHTSETS